MPSSSRKPITWRPPCQPAAYWPRAVPSARSAGSRTAERTFSFSWRSESASNDTGSSVAGGADPVVVPRPAADPDVLRHGDLHVVHVRPVPDRLVQRVGEAERQDVL